MNRTVEKGKTLLVDGPASVTVVSGVVEVFGSILGAKSKVVIREGKRLPFAVGETATFEISLGENAGTEEVDENTIPSSWAKAFEELSNFQTKTAVAMVMGNVDSGKTSFCTYLINRLLHKKRKVAILDGDLGQSDIGPPCTVAYAFVTKPITDLFSLQAKNAFFVGVTSPSLAVNRAIEGLTSLKKEILGGNPDFIVINTDGWIEGENAINYKVQLAEKLVPDIIFCIQQENELAPIIGALEKFRKIIVDSPSAIKQRSREKRRSLRELGYIKYLKNAKVQSFPISWLKIEENELFSLGLTHGSIRQARKVYELLGMKPLHFVELKDKICIVIGKSRWINKGSINKVEEGLGKKVVVIRKGEEEGMLVALHDANKKFLGIGVLREVDYTRKTLKIFTPVSEGISTVVMGRVKLDKNLKEIPTFMEKQ
ncbi:MAG: Clp1/GlmU family protein [Candidatus Bathyarchaeia archaeon]